MNLYGVGKWVVILLLATSNLCAGEDEHTLFNFSSGGLSADGYFDTKKIPNVRISSRRYPKCEKNCTYPVIEDANRQVLRRYSVNSSLYAIASGRYENVAYLQYKESYDCGDKTCYKNYLVDQNGRGYSTLRRKGGYDARISRDRHLYEVGAKGIYRDGIKILSAPFELEHARMGNNPKGDMAAIAIDEHDDVYVTNLKTWHQSQVHLSSHGDRSGVLAIYPKDKNELYSSLYQYTNAYNKGIKVSHIEMKEGKEQTGWLINSAERNVGFDPEVYVSGTRIYFSAKDSTNRERVSTSLSADDFKRIVHSDNRPKHIEGFENESGFSFLLGSRLAYYKWDAKSYVEKDDTTFASMNYDISDTTYTALYFEGRVYNVRLGLSYLQNWVEKQGTNAKVASKLFSGFVDFEGLFSRSSSLRIEYAKAQLSGNASYKDNAKPGVSSGAMSQNILFDETFSDLAAKVMFERGWFVGAEYMEYTLPSAIGFSDSSKDITYVTLDPSFNIQEYLLVAGYDEISYARRYETDLSRFYFQGQIGMGFNNYNISNDVKEQIEQNTQKKILSLGSFTVLGETDIGYIWQQRFRSWQGFGYAFTTGLKARGTWTSSGQSDDSDNTIKSDELELEMERYDLWYGPYVSFNLLF